MKVHQLLEKPENWTQYDFAEDKNGKSVRPQSNKAVCWCLMGAVRRCYGADSFDRVTKLLWSEVLYREKRGPMSWNDLACTKHEDVYNLVKELDI